MAYNFTDKSLAEFLNYVFSVAAGHDHDGVNSKAVTTGTPAAGSVTVTELASNALAASAAGRLKMATGYFDAATVAAKFGTDSFTAAVLVQLIQDGAFAATAAARALFAAGFFDSATVVDKFAANCLDTNTLNQIVADGAFAADANSRALIAADFFDAATVADKFATDSFSNAVLIKLIANDAFQADANTRALFQANFFDAACVTSKFAADSFTNANLLQLVQDGAFVADASTRALFADGFVSLAKMAATAKTHVLSIPVETLAAGVDITARALLQVPASMTFTLTGASIISNGTAVGIDAGNTCVIALSDGTNAICSATYNDANPFPAENVLGSLGALDVTHKVLAAAENLTLSVTNAATANPPAFILQVTYTMADA